MRPFVLRVCLGGSNGGALVGAVMNRAGEEIFAAGIAQVGCAPSKINWRDRVLHLLRYHLFTIEHAWKSDFGDPDIKEDFEFIYKWSPYHNIRDVKTANILQFSARQTIMTTECMFRLLILLTISVPLHPPNLLLSFNTMLESRTGLHYF
jgi:Prolyl oligopeptidase family